MSRHINHKIALTLILAAALLRLHSGGASAETAKPMRIGVIGAGSLGGTVGSVWSRRDMK